MANRLTRTRWLPVVSGAVAAVLAFAALPMTALANDELSPGPYSQSSQLSTDAYSALGLTVSDDTGDAGTYAPYGNDENVSTTLLSDDEVYMAANGARNNVYTLRGKLNQLYDANTYAESLCAQAHNDSNALDAIMCRVGAGRQAEGHIGNPLST